jgi:hypothetical protein
MSLVIALAGRRIDSSDADAPRFPLANVPLVRQRLRSFFAEHRATTLVCSAACGADLVALEAAQSLGMRCRIVLPFEPEKFRETSVTDRPGDWGPLYDRTSEVVRHAGDLVVLANCGEGGAAYAAANQRILEEAVSVAKSTVANDAASPSEALAAIVWEGRSRGPDDNTQQFAELARERGLKVQDISTLDGEIIEGNGNA